MARARHFALLAAAAALCAAATAQLPGGLGSSGGVDSSSLGGAGSSFGVSTTGPATGAGVIKDDQHFFPMPGDGTDPGIVVYEDVRIDVGKASGQPVNVIVAKVTKPKGFVRMFTAMTPHNATQRTGVIAERNKCTLATNNGVSDKRDIHGNKVKNGDAGYRKDTFKYADWVLPNSVCYDVTVIDGQLICPDSGAPAKLGYGVTQDDRWAWGKFTGAEAANFKYFRTVISRNDWLVDNGKVWEPCKDSWGGACTSSSARTGLGLTENNELLIVTVDGSSGEFDDDEGGCTLDEFARVMHQLGAKFALNQDGGGSTTIVAARSFKANGDPNIKVLNYPSDCISMTASAIGAYDTTNMDQEPWYAQAAMNLAGMGTRGFCQRKRPDILCIGDDTSTFTVPAPVSGILNGCNHDTLKENMVGMQRRFCEEGYQMVVQHSFDTDLREAYEDVLAVIADYKAQGKLACAQPSAAPYYMANRDSTCEGANTADEAFYRVAMTALLARRTKHYFGTKRDAGIYAEKYMNAGYEMVSGWNASDVRACNGNEKLCLRAANSAVNHAVGERVYSKAWGPYQKCTKVWRWRNGRLRRIERCRDKYIKPSIEKLARQSYLAVCDALKKDRLFNIPTSLNNIDTQTQTRFYNGKAFYTYGSPLLAADCAAIQALETADDASLAGSIEGVGADPGVYAFFVGIGLAGVGAAVFARHHIRKRGAAARDADEQAQLVTRHKQQGAAAPDGEQVSIAMNPLVRA